MNRIYQEGDTIMVKPKRRTGRKHSEGGTAVVRRVNSSPGGSIESLDVGYFGVTTGSSPSVALSRVTHQLPFATTRRCKSGGNVSSVTQASLLMPRNRSSSVQLNEHGKENSSNNNNNSRSNNRSTKRHSSEWLVRNANVPSGVKYGGKLQSKTINILL